MAEWEVEDLDALRKRLTRTQEVLGALITWMAQSATSPITGGEAEMLLMQLDEAGE